MPTFGFSAYLKLISLNTKPQRTEIRKRYTPSDEQYDFHRSLRLRANRLLEKGEKLDDVLLSVESLKNPAERSSVRSGLSTLLSWRRTHPGELFKVGRHTYSSPNGVFKVVFSADFGTTIDGRRCAVHLWNTKKPPLSKNLTVGTLSMLKVNYPELDELVVLSLLDNELVRSVDHPSYAAVGQNLAVRLENVILDVEDEMGIPHAPPPPRPTPTQPPAHRG